MPPMNSTNIDVSSLPLRKRGKDRMGAVQMKLTGSWLLTAIFSLLSLSPAYAEKPRIYTANPIEAGVAYNQRARDAYSAGVWTLEEAEDESQQSTESSVDQRRAYARAL